MERTKEKTKSSKYQKIKHRKAEDCEIVSRFTARCQIMLRSTCCPARSHAKFDKPQHTNERTNISKESTKRQLLCAQFYWLFGAMSLSVYLFVSVSVVTVSLNVWFGSRAKERRENGRSGSNNNRKRISWMLHNKIRYGDSSGWWIARKVAETGDSMPRNRFEVVTVFVYSHRGHTHPLAQIYRPPQLHFMLHIWLFLFELNYSYSLIHSLFAPSIQNVTYPMSIHVRHTLLQYYTVYVGFNMKISLTFHSLHNIVLGIVI